MAEFLEPWVRHGEGPGVAPEPLEAVRALLNTDDRFHGTDRLTGAPEELVAFRDAVRTYLEGGDTEALAVVAGRHPLAVAFSPEAPGASTTQLVPVSAQDGLAAAIAGLLVIVHEEHARGSWRRLKLCDNPACRWVFYDASRNRSGRWCAMGVCGEVMKSRSYRDRRRAGPPQQR